MAPPSGCWQLTLLVIFMPYHYYLFVKENESYPGFYYHFDTYKFVEERLFLWLQYEVLVKALVSSCLILIEYIDYKFWETECAVKHQVHINERLRSQMRSLNECGTQMSQTSKRKNNPQE
jgi:hypothetical protein